MRPTLTQARREMARGSRDVLATMLLLTGPREDHHVPLPRHRSILLSPQASAAGGFPLASLALSAGTASSAPAPNSSKSSAGTTRARAAQAAAFRRCCRGTGRFDGVQADYYVRDK